VSEPLSWLTEFAPQEYHLHPRYCPCAGKEEAQAIIHARGFQRNLKAVHPQSVFDFSGLELLREAFGFVDILTASRIPDE